jgi:hypothetical protein
VEFDGGIDGRLRGESSKKIRGIECDYLEFLRKWQNSGTVWLNQVNYDVFRWFLMGIEG